MHNVNSMFYVGQEPWHGLGKKLDQAATAADAIKAAGMEWEVIKAPVLYTPPGKMVRDAVGHYVTARADNGAALGVVGERYTILQNREAFSFFDAVVGEKLAIYHTAGALGAGETVWILAKLPGEIRTVGDDISEKFLLLTNRHDGSGSVEIMFTPIRVVCQNTLNIALSDENGKRAKVRHTASMGLGIERVRETLGLLNSRFALFEDLSRQMANKQLGSKDLDAYLSGLFKTEAAEGSKRAESRAANVMEEVERLFNYGKGNNLPGVKGSAWAAFNAVTEYADHFRTVRGEKGLDNRAKSLLFGTGADLKQRAWDGALALLK